jgi:hypothetical protein
MPPAPSPDAIVKSGHDLYRTAHRAGEILGFECEPGVGVGRDQQPIALCVARGAEHKDPAANRGPNRKPSTQRL